MRSRWLRLILVLTLAQSLAALALADGCFLGPSAVDRLSKPSSAAQKAVLIAEGPDEVLLLQTTYQGPARRFAWVIPVPSPPKEVFAAEPNFLDQVFLWTEPRLDTEITVPDQRSSRQGGKGGPSMGPGMGGAPEGGMGGAPGPPPVEVLQRLQVGDYAATVLAARDPAALTSWLQTHRYAVPDGAAEAFASYVQRGWAFVALRLLDRAVQGKPVLTDVAPLGLRFTRPAEGLVFPLAISQVSAPPLSALLLCLITDEPQECLTLPTVWLERPRRLRPGETYGALRRRLTREPRTALLGEYADQRPLYYSDLSYRRDDWTRSVRPRLERRFATRLFGLVAPAEMRDVYFGPSASTAPRDYHLLVRRHGKVSLQALRALVQNPPGLGQAAGDWATWSRYARLAEPPPYREAYVALGVLVCVVVLVVVWLTRRRGPLPLIAIALAALLVGAGGAVLAGGVPRYEALDELVKLATQAADDFRRDTGLHPATVADLASRVRPAQGLDPSGNAAPLGDGWQGPYLSRVPEDPLGGEGLVVDPLNSRLVDSGGYEVTVEAVSRDRWPLRGSAFETANPDFWTTHPDEMRAGLTPYRRWLAWLAGRSASSLVTADFVGWYSHATAARRQGTLLADRRTRQFWLADRAATFTPSGRLSVAVAARQTDSMEPNAPLSFVEAAGLEGCAQLTPAPHPGNIADLWCSPDGRTMACATSLPSAEQVPDGRGGYAPRCELRLVTATGLSEPLFTGPVYSAAVAPDGKRLYVLSSGQRGDELVRVSLPGGPSRVLAERLSSAGVLQVTPRGVLVAGPGGELRIVTDDGGVTTIGDCRGTVLTARACGGTVIVVTAQVHGIGSSRDSTTVGVYALSLAGGRPQLLGRFAPPGGGVQAAILAGAADRATLVLNPGGTQGKWIEIALGHASAWRLTETRWNPDPGAGLRLYRASGESTEVSLAAENGEPPLLPTE
jgi:hypothetical protein